MIPLYKSLIRPIIEYANPVWCPYTRMYIDLIEDIQHYFTRCIIGMKNMDYEYESRLRKLKLPSLEYRRVRGDLIEVYKICHHIYDPVTTSPLLTFAHSNTRAHNYKLNKPRVNTKQFQHFFSNRVVNIWNNLPPEVVSAPSTNSFKNKIDKLFNIHMYSTNLNLYYWDSKAAGYIKTIDFKSWSFHIRNTQIHKSQWKTKSLTTMKNLHQEMAKG